MTIATQLDAAFTAIGADYGDINVRLGNLGSTGLINNAGNEDYNTYYGTATTFIGHTSSSTPPLANGPSGNAASVGMQLSASSTRLAQFAINVQSTQAEFQFRGNNGNNGWQNWTTLWDDANLPITITGGEMFFNSDKIIQESDLDAIGIGGNVVDVADLNTLSVTAPFRIVGNCANAPETGAGYGYHFQRTPIYALQVAYMGSNTYTRELSTTWRPWVRSLNSDDEVVSPTVLRRRYIDVADYAPSSGSNWHAGIQAAFNDGYGKEIVFTNDSVNNSKVYTLDNRTDGRLTLPRKARIIGADRAYIDSTAWGISGTAHPLFYGEGLVRDPINTQSRPTQGDTTLDMGSTNLNRVLFYMGIEKVSRWPVYLRSLTEFFTQDEGTLGLKGELVWVTGSSSSTTATLESPIVDDYTGGDCTAEVAQDLLDLTFDNLTMIGAGRLSGPVGASGRSGDVGILLVNALSATVNGGSFDKFDKHGLHFINTNKITIRDATVSIQQDPNFGRLQYPIAIANGCEHALVENCDIRGGREGLSLTSSGTMPGVTRNVTIRSTRFRSHYRSGIALHDNHENVSILDNLFEDCEQFIDIRVAGRGSLVAGNRGFRSGAYTGSLDCAVQLASGAGNLVIKDNQWYEVLRGHWMPETIDHEVPPGDITIDGDLIRSTKPGHGTLLDFDGSARTPGDSLLGKLRIVNVDYDIGAGGGSRAVQAHGRWQDVEITGTLRGGAGAQSVYLATAEHQVRENDIAISSSGNGPSNPSIDIRQGPSFTYPLISWATGVKTTKVEGIGYNAPGHVFTSNEYFTVGSIAPNNKSTYFHTLTGVRIGDFVTVSAGAPNDGILVSGEVSSNDTIRVTFTNLSSATINPVDGQVYFRVVKR